MVCAWLIRYSICGEFCSRGLSPPTRISDTSGLQVNFASIIPDQAAPDLIELGIGWSLSCFFEMTSVQSMLGSRIVRRWIRIWYETVVWCWRWYRYGYRYLPFHHLATLGRWKWTVCWNEFRKYTYIVPCDMCLRFSPWQVHGFAISRQGARD